MGRVSPLTLVILARRWWCTPVNRGPLSASASRRKRGEVLSCHDYEAVAGQQSTSENFYVMMDYFDQKVSEMCTNIYIYMYASVN